MDYNRVSLEDVCDLVAGYAFKSKDFGNYSSKVIKIAHITPPTVDMEGLSGVDITKYNPQKLEKYIAGSGDFVLAMTGATIGKIGRIEQGNAYINQRVLLFKNRNSIDKDYLYYVLQQYEFEQYILSHIDSESAQPNISAGTIGKYTFNLPDMEIQRKIGRLLRSLDAKREINRKINDNLLEQASALFEKAIRQSNSLSKVELSSLAEVKGGKRLPKGVNLVTVPNQHPYIRVRDLNNAVYASLSKDYEYVDNETQKSISRYIVSTDDVLVSIVGTIGLTAIVDSTLNKANLTENCVKLTNLKRVTPEYLLLFLRSAQGVEAISKGTVGAVQLKLPIKNIQSISVPVLCVEELEPLNVILSAIFSQISTNVVEIKKLAEMRDTLLPRLLSGELDVSGIDL